MALVVGAGALLLTSVVVAVAPRMWRIANAHEEVPVALPDFADARGALVRVRRAGQRDREVRGGEQPADRARRRAAARDRRVPRGRGSRVLRPPRGQRAEPAAGDAVELRVRGAGAGRVDDHHAGGQERLHGGLRTRRPVQAPAGDLRGAAREAEEQGRDPRALPQHRVLRAELVRHRRRGRDLLRQAGRRRHVHRGRVPGRPRSGAVELRPDHPSRAEPHAVHPGARPDGGGDAARPRPNATCSSRRSCCPSG